MKTIAVMILAAMAAFSQAQTARPVSPAQPAPVVNPPQPARPAPPARNKIVNSQADVAAQQAGSITIQVDAEGMTALLCAATAQGTDIQTYVAATVQRVVQDNERRFPPADVWAAQQTVNQNMAQHTLNVVKAVQVQVQQSATTPATPATPAKP
jgi:hypothetical protein